MKQKRGAPEGGHYDVVIIGTGAGGGTLLSKLAPTGKRILVLERGGFLQREKDNWNLDAVQIRGKYNPSESWYDDSGAPFAPGVKYNVGGNTKVWGAALLRMRPSDFGEVRHEGGISPAWPIEYADLEPYYTEAERLYRVRGERGSDPTEGPASSPYAFGPVRHEPRVVELLADLRNAGVNPWPLPLGLMLDDASPERESCIRCDTCDGFPCLVRGKSDAEVICVEPALRHPNVTLMLGSKALRLETDAAGRAVERVVVQRNGHEERFSADVFAVSCGAINSAALLLRSVSDRHPHGLANSSGLVGRNYMCHQNSAVFALSERENRSVLQKTWGISDWYHRSRDWEFPMGLIQPLNRTPSFLLEKSPISLAAANGHGPEYLSTHSLEFWLTSEDLPDVENQVALRPDGSITVRYRPNNTEAHRRLGRQLATIVGRIERNGFEADRSMKIDRMPIGVCSHQCGTLRFGADPRASVLDLDCRAHDVDNLYAVDAAFFPSSGAVNPSLTIIANALRVGDRLIERMG
jgi:choline dehydrogenase-like flavoprotein